STEVSQGCAKGCDLCSEFNGCLKCSPKLFILLERNDIRQIGICLPSCPLGYFGVRNPDMNKCIKCKIENCEACFSRNFCTKCKEGLYLHKGRCYSTCPDGYSAANGTMECSSPAQCELSEWGPWGPCAKKRKLCGFKKGNEERSRKVLQAPSGDVSVCPATTELRKCTVQKNQCPEERLAVQKSLHWKSCCRGAAPCSAPFAPVVPERPAVQKSLVQQEETELPPVQFWRGSERGSRIVVPVPELHEALRACRADSKAFGPIIHSVFK
ncbi:R-spondin-1, partial [Chelonia mydas]